MVNKIMFWASWAAIPVSFLMKDSTAYVVILSHLAITYSAYLAIQEEKIKSAIESGPGRSDPGL